MLITATIGAFQAHAQDRYHAFREAIGKLYRARAQDLDALWSEMVSENKIPVTCEDSVAFLYRGPARSVNWMGDFNGWGYDKQFATRGTRIPGTDVWILKRSLPKDARLDYKILLNNQEWIIDPANHASQWSGVGGGSINSELQMPYWKRDSLTISRIDSAKRGNVMNDILLNSRELGYQMTYSIYFPADYHAGESYTILYVTDGYEYMHERMGNMITILDNLIALGKIPPVIAVFIDHREPVNRFSNRRMTELSMNERYVNFITREFIPAVERTWMLRPAPYSRIIMGNSAGALFATWLAFSHPDLFPLLGIQSPSFSFQPQIYSFVEKAQKQPVRVFLTSGRIHDSDEAARKMKGIFEKRSCTFEYKQVNQGHSWGNWRDLTDDLLVYLLKEVRDR